MWIRRVVVAVGAILLAAGTSRAVGTIARTGATIAAGPAPAQGTVNVDPAAPVGVIPTIPAVAGPGPAPTLTGTMPAPPSFGDGSGGAFSASSGTTALLPGTHQFSSFSVTNGAAVTLSGATTVLVTGNVSIAGRVTSGVAGASISFRCGGDFTLVSRNPASLVQTSMASSPIEIVAGGRILVGTDVTSLDAQIDAAGSDVTLVAHGSTAGASGVIVKSGRVTAPSGAVTVLATGPFDMGGILVTRSGRIDCLGPLTIRSYGDRIAANSNGDFLVTAGPATFEAAGQLLVGGDLLLVDDFPLALQAVAGPLDVYGPLGTEDGDATLASGGRVNFFGGTVSSSGSGDVSIAAGARFSLGSGAVSAATGDVELVAAGDVFVGGSVTAGGAATVRASGGTFVLSGSGAISAGTTASVHATGTIDIGDPGLEEKAPRPTRAVTRGSFVTVVGGEVEIVGGADVILDAATARASGPAGDFRVLAQGPLTVARTISARGDVSMQSLAGDVDVAGAEVRSEDMEADGSVVVETWKPGGAIDATGATIRSGASAGTSGAVAVLVHDPAAAVVESFILPKKVVFRSVPGRPEKTRLVASGFYDVGTAAVDFAESATVTVGSHAFAVPADGFVPNRKGTVWKHSSDALRVKIAPNRFGSSRARCRLDARGAVLDGRVPADGEATLAFRFGGAIEGAGTVTLAQGRYKLGKKRGALVAPNLFPVRSKATLRGPGKDALAIVVGLATDGVTPSAAPDLVLEFGDGFAFSRASGEFVRRGHRFVADGVVLDYARETVAVTLKRIDLGPGFVEGPQPVVVRVALGAESREVRVRMVRSGKRLSY